MRRGALLPVVLLLLAGSACRERDPLTNPRAVPGLVERTKPPGATLVSLSGPTENNSGMRAEWEISTGMTWEVYASWVGKQLGKDFSAAPGAGPPLIFKKALPADEITLQVERLSAGTLLHVRVTFSALPF